MKKQAALALIAHMAAALAKAEETGAKEIDLVDTLQAQDDAARAELQRAIDAAEDK